MQRAFQSILVVIAIGLLPAAQARPAGDWKIVQSAGDVAVLVDGAQKAAAAPNMSLPEDAIIATGNNGRAVVSRGDQQIVVQPNARLKLTNSSPSSTRFLQSTGSALYRIGKHRTPNFQVDTPYLAAIVKGTVFSVSVNGAHAGVAVTEGAVEVSSNAGEAVTLVRPGMTARVAKADRRTIDLQDRSGTRRLVTANEGGWGSADARGGTSSSSPTGGQALLRTGIDQAPVASQAGLSGLRGNTIAVEIASASDAGALRLNTTQESSEPPAAATALDGAIPTGGQLRQSLAAGSEGAGSRNRMGHGMGSTLDNAAKAVSGKVDAGVRSLARHRPLKVAASMPWTELSLGILALITVMVISHIRSLRIRTRRIEALA